MSVFGQIIDGAVVEAELTAHLKETLPHYIAEVERQNGVTEGTYARPRSWTNSPNFDLDPRLEAQWPAILVICAGTSDPPKKEGNGNFRAVWGAGVAIMVQAIDADAASIMSKRYGAAARTAIMQNKKFSPNVRGIDWQGEVYDDIPSEKGRNMASARLVFEIEYHHIFNDKAGPGMDALRAHADPLDPYPDNPTVETPIPIVTQGSGS